MTLDYFTNKGVKVLNEMPNGWSFIQGATTAPIGYKWVNNGKSLFSKQYEHALLKIEE
ncbi:MAG: hypothetical protein J6R47_02365 [Acholeplasmatales bacterium]|nr:hypothetical protein [Acholeplasmatales bacterium]